MMRNGGGGRAQSPDGIRELWRKWEPRGIRVLLLAVSVLGLVAGFVKPVGDAIQGKTYFGGALLSLVAFLLYDSVKALTEAVAVRESRTGAAAMRHFGVDVVAAFGVGRAEICVLGYTGETLLQEIKEGLAGLRKGQGNVTIRVLVPDFSQPRLIPGLRQEGGSSVDDPAFRVQEILPKCRSVSAELAGAVRDVSEDIRVSRRVTFEYLVYDGVPDVKLVILNDECALYGFYDPENTRTWEGNSYRDPSGAGTQLTRVTVAEGGADARRAIHGWKVFFEARWSTARVPVWPNSTNVVPPASV
ncbi:hypothetical protein [Streptomyces sp. NPDC050145]|uniref:hypothetical protein n=1 Tax=Streptomyces sp. NPDC050145 TaxID=3365602 RepID=UPI0037AA7AE8